MTRQYEDETQHPAAPDWRAALGSAAAVALRHRAFVVAAIVLVAAAAGLNAAVGVLRLHFKKQAVPMRMSFAEAMPEVIGTWVQAAREETIDPDVLDALGTDKYLFCTYINAVGVGMTVGELQKLLHGRSLPEQKAEVIRLRRINPAAIVNLGLTYYTGKADTVAHIPERCYIGDGFDILASPATLSWGLDRDLSVRHIVFEGQAGQPPCEVVYFFHVNGRYEADSLRVRSALQSLLQRYGYYAKIELMVMLNSTAMTARSSMQDFLAVALPHIEAALPDWRQYGSR